MRNLTDDKKKDFTRFWGINQTPDKAILVYFNQNFPITLLIWACQVTTDLSLN